MVDNLSIIYGTSQGVDKGAGGSRRQIRGCTDVAGGEWEGQEQQLDGFSTAAIVSNTENEAQQEWQ